MHDPLSDTERDPVEVLVEEFLAARRRGEEIELDGFVSRAGERASELRELLESAIYLEEMKSARPRGLSLHTPRVLGDYRVLGEIGRGGMGVVYEAEQITLGRRVALKVLPTHALRNEKRLERFKREAQTAAKLHHTNIVPIFGVGEQDGDHYYVMQLIVGRSLDDIVRAVRGEPRTTRRPLWSGASTAAQSAESAAEQLRRGTYAPKPPSSGDVGPGDLPYYRSVASLGMQAAEALAYAHAQGTLHRDIKPANLILDDHGVLWITDFGLAKVIEDGSFTLSGDLVGTLQYMAPEQLAGQADPRTDVHGLGLVLYELATLRPGFSAESRGELIEKVRNQEPTPPGKVREGVPRDLDTIIRKATAKDPGHRYATAQELRDDLERFLQDRPIRARPVSAIESGWRWCRRNRVLATSGALAVLGLISTAVVGIVGYVSTKQALGQARAAQELAEDKSQLAEDKSKLAEQKSRLAQENVALALQGFEDLFSTVVGPELLRPDDDEEGDVVAPEAARKLTAANEALLEQMLGFYDQLAEKNRDNAEARQLAARAYHRVAEIHFQLGKQTEAIASYERAVELYGELAKSGAVPRGTWLQVQNGLARVLYEANRGGFGDRRNDRGPGEPPGRGGANSQARREAYRAREARARALLEAVIAAGDGEDSALVRFERARAYDQLGLLAFGPGSERRGGPLGRGRGDGPGREEGRSREGARPGEPEAPEPRREGRGGGPDRVDPWAGVRSALAHHRQALAINQDLLTREPGNVAYQHATARSCRLIANILIRAGESSRAEALAMKRRAVDLLEALVAADPRASFRLELIEALTVGLGRSGADPDLAMPARAVAVAESLMDEFPAVRNYRFMVVIWAEWLAGHDRDNAQSWRRRAVRAHEAEVRAQPETGGPVQLLARTAIAMIRGCTAGDAQGLVEARDIYGRACQRLEEMSRAGADYSHRATSEACTLRIDGAQALAKVERLDLARVELAAAEEWFVRLQAAPVGAFESRGWFTPPTPRTVTAERLAAALLELGDPATGAHERAAALRKR